MTSVSDLTASRVLYMAEERKRSSLDGFWPTLTVEHEFARLNWPTLIV